MFKSYWWYRCRAYVMILKNTVSKIFFGGKRRTREFVLSEYASRWAASVNNVGASAGKLRPALLHGELVFLRGLDHVKYFISQISREINELHPEKVLELGSGNGFNILALAALNPDVKIWCGVELTHEGVEASQKLFTNPPYRELKYVTGIPKEKLEILLGSKTRIIQFIQGDILSLPYRDREFEFVFSCFVIEQIPRDYSKAFREAYRVSKIRGLFIEAFAEAQKNIFEIMHLWNMDYFRSSIHEVEEAGFTIIKFELLKSKKLEFTGGVLLCERKM